jgi:hypothetical protein
MGGCGCGGDDKDSSGAATYPYAFQAFLTDAEPGEELRLSRGDNALWNRRAPDAAPRLTSFRARLAGARQKGSTELVLEWKVAAGGDQEPEGWLQWSSDAGENWYALTTGLRGGKATLDASSLPSGRVQLRLLISDGFHTTVSKAVSVTMPRRPAEPAILSPRDGQTFVTGSPMRLWGSVVTGDAKDAPPKNSRWLLDGEAVAEGLDAFITAPEAGEHRLTLVVESGGRADVSLTFQTVRLPDLRD